MTKYLLCSDHCP